MAKETEIICIICPLACRVTVSVDDGGSITGVANNLCKRGEEHAIAECKFPGRILTATVLTKSKSRKLLPVRTMKPIPKERLMEAMYSLSKIEIKLPVRMGQVVVSNIAGTGVDLVATEEL